MPKSIDEHFDELLTPEEQELIGVTADNPLDVRLRRLLVAYQSCREGNERLHKLNNQLEKKQIPVIEGGYPLVLYFGTQQEVDEFTEICKRSNPNLRPTTFK